MGVHFFYKTRLIGLLFCSDPPSLLAAPTPAECPTHDRFLTGTDIHAATSTYRRVPGASLQLPAARYWSARGCHQRLQRPKVSGVFAGVPGVICMPRNDCHSTTAEWVAIVWYLQHTPSPTVVPRNDFKQRVQVIQSEQPMRTLHAHRKLAALRSACMHGIFAAWLNCARHLSPW